MLVKVSETSSLRVVNVLKFPPFFRPRKLFPGPYMAKPAPTEKVIQGLDVLDGAPGPVSEYEVVNSEGSREAFMVIFFRVTERVALKFSTGWR